MFGCPSPSRQSLQNSRSNPPTCISTNTTCWSYIVLADLRQLMNGWRSTDESVTVLTCAITQVADAHKCIDGLVLNAGVLEPICRIGSTETTLDQWKHHFDVNFFSLVPAIQAALPALRRSPRGGRIVFVSSGAAIKGSPGWGPYNASKAAMNSLCRYIRSFCSAPIL